MEAIIVVLLLSFVVVTFFGHVVHWALHRPWSGPAYRSHMKHHSSYPPNDLTSKKYRAEKWHSTGTFLFTPPLMIILATFGGLMWALGVPLWIIVTFGAALILFGLFSDWAHDAMHLELHWMHGFRWFQRLRVLHFQHHRNVRVNFGIVSLLWDRAFRTFKDR